MNKIMIHLRFLLMLNDIGKVLFVIIFLLEILVILFDFLKAKLCYGRFSRIRTVNFCLIVILKLINFGVFVPFGMIGNIIRMFL